MNPDTGTPRVFISYTHYDGERSCKEEVLEFANWLRDNGVDAVIDQFVQHTPPKDFPLWMEDQVRIADVVLAVCNASYRERFDTAMPSTAGRGVRHEGLILRREVYYSDGNAHKVSPVHFGARNEQHIPLDLQTTLSFDVTSDEGRNALISRIFVEPTVHIHPIGPRPDLILSPAGRISIAPPPETFLGLITSGIQYPEKVIDLDTGVRQLVNCAKRQIASIGLSVGEPEPNPEAYRERLQALEAAMQLTIPGFAVLGAYCQGEQLNALSHALTSLYDAQQFSGHQYYVWLELQQYPATLALYAAGVAAVSRGNWSAIGRILMQEVRSGRKESAVHLCKEVAISKTLPPSRHEFIPGMARRIVPGSDYALPRLLECGLSDVVSGEEAAECFDAFEMFVSLAACNPEWPTILPGRFVYQLEQTRSFEDLPGVRMLSERSAAQGLLDSGAFGGRKEQLESALAFHSEEVRKVYFHLTFGRS